MKTAYTIASLAASKTPSPSQTPFPSETPTPRPTLSPALPLDPGGPWLLFTARTDHGTDVRNLWATNADGTHMNKLVDEHIVAYAVQPGSSLASGALVAYVSVTNYETRDLTLKILHLPSGQIETITPLVNDKDGQPPIGLGDARYAVSDGGLAWSADGQQLAFVGQIDGPSMDVYRYEVATHSIHWLSSGETQAFHLEWSPDQRWIVHGGFMFIGMGGADTDGLWAADTDGRGATTLFGSDKDPDQPAGSLIVYGWLDDHHILLTNLLYEGESVIQAVDIRTGETQTVLTAAFAAAVSSPTHDTWLLTPPYEQRKTMPLRLWHNGAMMDIPGYVLASVWWSAPYNAFIGSAFNENKLYAISESGQVTELPITGYWQSKRTPPVIIPAPDATLWAWHDIEFSTGVSELFIGEPMAAPVYIVGSNEGLSIEDIIWSPDSQRLLLFTEHGLWAAERPDFEPVQVVDGSYVSWWNGENPQWVP